MTCGAFRVDLHVSWGNVDYAMLCPTVTDYVPQFVVPHAVYRVIYEVTNGASYG